MAARRRVRTGGGATRALLTTRDIAERIGVSEREVQRLAQVRGIAPATRGMTWHARDLPRFKRRKRGRPRAGRRPKSVDDA